MEPVGLAGLPDFVGYPGWQRVTGVGQIPSPPSSLEAGAGNFAPCNQIVPGDYVRVYPNDPEGFASSLGPSGLLPGLALLMQQLKNGTISSESGESLGEWQQQSDGFFYAFYAPPSGYSAQTQGAPPGFTFLRMQQGGASDTSGPTIGFAKSVGASPQGSLVQGTNLTSAAPSTTTYLIAGILGVLVIGGIIYAASE
jgi:hypothetical protein